jgi:hypothetical protein
MEQATTSDGAGGQCKGQTKIQAGGTKLPVHIMQIDFPPHI